MADPSPPTSTKEEAEKAAAKKVQAYTWGCLFLLIGGCVAIMNCPESSGPTCGRQHAAWREAEERRETLERLGRFDEVPAAQRLEEAAERAWRACIGR